MERSPAEKGVLIIKLATPDDAEGIESVGNETWLATYPNAEHGVTKEDIVGRRAAKAEGRIDRLREEIAGSATSRTWVVKDGDRVIGFCRARTGGRPEVGAIYILPEYQNRGFGAKLMEEAMTWLGKDKDIYVDVVSYNDQAINFYKSLGFENTGETKAAELPGGKSMPVMVMIRKAAKG